MDDEFKLCWKNFQDNIASGFQNLYDRGDLVDVTLACDGKLLQAHKIVLAICSPYFQEIFISNPCKHPIIILKDVSYTIMCELLEFMYQGVVNVKHTELQAFMKIGQLLQIKGLATNSSSSATSSISDKSTINNNAIAESEAASSQPSNNPLKSNVSPLNDVANNTENTNKPDKQAQTNSNSNTPQRTQSPLMSPASPSLNISNISQKPNNDNQLHHSFHLGSGGVGHKRHLSDFNSESLSIYSRNKIRRSLAPTDHSSENNDVSDVGGSSSMDQMNTEDFFLPHMSMVESRYDMNNVKRENADHHHHPNNPSAAAAAAAAAASLRNTFNPAAFGLDYTFYKNNSGSAPSSQEYPNDLNISGDFSKGFANHMDIPANCPNVVMLSSTSLLHGNCVFNRNNTVATQQGMKTYWLCKSYRISMCRARCITHQGKIISATGVHNHPPHMRGNNGGGPTNVGGSLADGNVSGGTISGNISNNGGPAPPAQSSGGSGGGLRFGQIGSPSANMFPPNFHGPHHAQPISPTTPPSLQHVISGADTTTMNPTSSHHFVQSMPNLVHHPSNQSSQILTPLQPPPPSNVMPTIMHGSTVHSPQTHAGYDISPQSHTDHNRSATHQPFDTNDKSLKVHHLNDDNIPVHNAAELSPSNVHRNDDTDSTSDHHQHHQHQHQPVQVINSITISPGGNAHNFKMEPL